MKRKRRHDWEGWSRRVVCLLLFIRFDFLALRSCVTSPTNQMMMFFCRLLVNHCRFHWGGGAHHRMIPEMRNDVKVTLEAAHSEWNKKKENNRAKCVNMWSGVEFLVTGCRRYVPLWFIYFISLTVFFRAAHTTSLKIHFYFLFLLLDFLFLFWLRQMM